MYRILLLAYPASLRREYVAEIHAVFRTRLSVARAHGFVAVVRLYWSEVTDTLISGLTVELAKELAFEYLREFAPCWIRVMGEGFKEWRLEEPDGEWEGARHG